MNSLVKRRITALLLMCLSLSTLAGLQILPFLSQGPADGYSAGTLTYMQWAACQSGNPSPRILPCPANIAPNAEKEPQIGQSSALEVVKVQNLTKGDSMQQKQGLLIFKHLGFFPGIMLILTIILFRAVFARNPMGPATIWVSVILGITWLAFLILGGRMFFPHSPLGSNLATIHPVFVLFLATGLLFCVICLGEWVRLGQRAPQAGANKLAPAKKPPKSVPKARPSGPVQT